MLTNALPCSQSNDLYLEQQKRKKALAAAAEAEPDSEEEEGEDEPAVTSDVERPDDSDAEEKEHEGGDDSDGEEAKGKPKGKAKSKSTSKSTSKKSKSKAKGKGKGGSGGISMPEDWPWEEAKQLFLKPDVTPAEELEVRFCVCLRIFVFDAYLVQWYLLMLLFVPFPSLCLCLVLSWVMQLLIFFHVSLFHKQLEWKNPDVDGLIQFLVTEKGFKYVFPGLSLVSTDCPAPLLFLSLSHLCTVFPSPPSLPHRLKINSEDRVRKGAEKLQKFLNTKQQGRLDGFFTASSKPKEGSTSKTKGSGKGKDTSKEKGGNKKRKVCCLYLYRPL